MAGERQEIPPEERDSFPDKIVCLEADVELRDERIADAVSSALVDAAASVPASPDNSPNASAVSKEWFEKRAPLEGDLEVSAGRRTTATLNLTPDEIAKIEHLLPHRSPDPVKEKMAEALFELVWTDAKTTEEQDSDGERHVHLGITLSEWEAARAALAAYEAEKAAR